MATHCRFAMAALLQAGTLFTLPQCAVAVDNAEPSAEDMLKVPVSGNPVNPEHVAALPANPYADDAGAVVQGQALFHSMNCDGCHAPQAGGGMGPPLGDSEWIYGKAPAQIYLSIAQGRPQGMPAWGHVLPPASIWSMVRYIESLSHNEADTADGDVRRSEGTP